MNTKYFLNGLSLRQYCTANGLSENRYKMLIWLIKNKCMTCEEALSYKRPPAQADQLKRVRNCGRRFRGYSDKELEMSVKEAIHFGAMKRSKFTIGDKTVREYCLENGLSYNTIRDRIVKLNMSVREAITEPIVHPRKFYYDGKPINEVFDRKRCRRIYGRVTDGWPVETAMEVPVDSFHNRKPPEKWVKTKVWGSLGYRKSGVHITNSNKGGDT